MIVDFLKQFAKLVWPPHHTASAEQLHLWRIAVSVWITVLATTMLAHVLMVTGATPNVFSGFVKKDEYVQSRILDLRGDILEIYVKYCQARGDLAASYNEQLNFLLAEYNGKNGPPIQFLDCRQVKNESPET